jgi:hypothetical protein
LCRQQHHPDGIGVPCQTYSLIIMLFYHHVTLISAHTLATWIHHNTCKT